MGDVQRSKKLARLFKKAFGDQDVEKHLSLLIQWIQEKKPENLPITIEEINQMTEFVSLVNSSIEQADAMIELTNRSLQISSEELIQSNQELRRLNQTVKTMLDSLNEGFVVFNRDGIAQEAASKKAEGHFGRPPAGQSICDLLRIAPQKRQEFQDWFNLLFDERVDFEDIADFGPKKLAGTKDHISIKFLPMRNEEQNLIGVVMITVDISSEVEAKQEAEELKSYAEMIIRLATQKDNLISFFRFYRGAVARLIEEPLKTSHEQILRDLHTIKGGAGAFCMAELSSMTHGFESNLSEFFSGNDLAQNMNKKEYEETVKKIGIALQEYLKAFLEKHAQVLGPHITHDEGIKEVPVQELYVIGQEMVKTKVQGHLINMYVDKIFAVPVEKLFTVIESAVEMTAKRLNKKVKIELKNPRRIKLIPEIYTDVIESLKHLFNNAVVHGIETPSGRQENGKPETGKISVEFSVAHKQDQDVLILEVSDDGVGVDVDKIKDMMRKRGLSLPEGSEKAVLSKIFDSGFSTISNVTTLAGRGVGLDAVKNSVEKMGGTVQLTTQKGQGSKFTIRLPLISEPDWKNPKLASPVPKKEILQT